MDEPLSSLDAKLRSDLRLELKRIQQDLGATMLYVTHDQVEALTMASRIGVLDEGHLVQLGTPQQVYEDPVSVNVASRLGSPRINVLPRAALPNLALPEQVHTLGVRAEHIRLDTDDGLAPSQRTGNAGAHATAMVTRIERLSDQNLVHLVLTDSPHALIAAAPPGHVMVAGNQVRVELLQCLWFGASGERIRVPQSTFALSS